MRDSYWPLSAHRFEVRFCVEISAKRRFSPFGVIREFCWLQRKKNIVKGHSIDDGNECKFIYYMEESVLLGAKPLVDSIRHFIRDPSGVFSVCHLCECRIVQWRHDSRLLLLLNWFLHIMKRTLHVRSKIWILCFRVPLEHKIHIFLPPCNILYICSELKF